jgi:hypothetical protein
MTVEWRGETAGVVQKTYDFLLWRLPKHQECTSMQDLHLDITSPYVHHTSMRTTLTLDDEVLRIVRQYAESRSLALGKAVSELVQRGFTTQRPTRVVNGLRVFDLPGDSPPVTAKRVRELEAEDE